MFKNKEGKVRSGWMIAGMFGVVFLISIIVGIIVSIFSMIIYTMQMSAGGGVNPDNLSQKLQELSQGNSILDILLMPIQEAVYIIVPIIAWRYVLKKPLSSMGLTKLKNNRKDFILGLLSGIISITIVFMLVIISGTATVTDWTPHFTVKQLAFIVVYISVGFAEEIMTRGYVMSVLRQTRNIYVVIFLSAFLFAVLHGFNTGIGLIPLANLMLFGIVLSYIYIKSGNLWMCIGFHITWNYFQGCVFGLPVSGMESNGIITTHYIGNNIWNGGLFGPEGGLFVTVALLLGLLIVKLYFKNSKFDFMNVDAVEIKHLNNPSII